MIMKALVRKMAISCTQTEASAKRSGVSILLEFRINSLSRSSLGKVCVRFCFKYNKPQALYHKNISWHLKSS